MYFREGDHNVICARSGFKTKRSNCRWEYENGKRTILVDKRFWLKENPQNQPPRMPSPSVPDYVNAPTFNSAPYPTGILLDSSGNPILDSDGLWILTGA